MQSFHTNLTDQLMDTILKIKTKKDLYNFFEDVCTIKEILDMSKRLEAAKLLDKGDSYNEIIKKLEISTATLSRVSKALNYGTGGYKNAISKKEA